MVPSIEQPTVESLLTAAKGGWKARPRLTRQREKESVVPEALFHTAEFSRQSALRILDRNGLLCSRYVPATPYENMLIAEMALAKARIDRAAELQVAMEDRSVHRTACHWLEDQKTRALTLRGRLARDPKRVVHALVSFKQGAELMIELWLGLYSVLMSTEDWDEEQRSLALDLLAVPCELRTEHSAQLPAAGDKAGLTDLAAREIASLTRRIAEVLDERDQDSREDALASLAPDEDPRNKRLKRSEAIARRNYDQALAELKRVRAEQESGTGGVPQRLRSWDVDPLIARIQRIAEPPGVTAEIEAALGRVPQFVTPRPVVAAPVAEVVTEATSTAAPDTTAARTADPEASAASADAIASPVESPDTIATASPDDPAASTVALSTETPAQLSRRARKIHQRRLRIQQAAHRDAGPKGQ